MWFWITVMVLIICGFTYSYFELKEKSKIEELKIKRDIIKIEKDKEIKKK